MELHTIVRRCLLVLGLFLYDPFSTASPASALDVSQLVGRHLMISISGKQLTSIDREVIRRVKPGAIVLFKFNIESVSQLTGLIADIQKESLRYSGRKVILAVDQEGGDVIRIKTDDSIPSARALGSINDLKLTHEAGEQTGKLLSAFGIFLNLAPVLDVMPRFTHSLLINRSFSNDPQRVLEHASSFADGLLTQGVIPTFKHFPGHGSSRFDSHLTLPTAEGDLFDLLARQMYPFRVITQRYRTQSAVMMAHVRFPQLDSQAIPATFSHQIIRNILRKSFDYKGVVITDDLEMKALNPYGSLGERARRSLEAGSNLVMVLWNAKKQIQVASELVAYAKTNQKFHNALLMSLEPLEVFSKKFSPTETQTPAQTQTSASIQVREQIQTQNQIHDEGQTSTQIQKQTDTLQVKKILRGLASQLQVKDKFQYRSTEALLKQRTEQLVQFDWSLVRTVFCKDERDFHLIKGIFPKSQSLNWIPLRSNSTSQIVNDTILNSNSIWVTSGERTSKLFASLPSRTRNKIFVFDFKGYMNRDFSKYLVQFYFRPKYLDLALKNVLKQARFEPQHSSPSVAESSSLPGDPH